MPTVCSRVSRCIVALIAFVLVTGGAGLAGSGVDGDALPTASPQSQGFDPERLARLHARMKRYVDEGEHAGIVTLIARNGRIVDSRAWGHRDVERKLPMENDTIVRIYSMSKIVTSVAALILHEEGRLKLDDPVAKHLPALAKPTVFKGGTTAAPVLVPAKTPMTIRHLLTHTSGYGYGFGNTALDEILRKANVFDTSKSLDDFVGRAAKLPLAHEPGTRFTYGINTDLLGAVVEKVSGQKLEAFVQQRICGPLGMRDTGYDVPADKRSRLALVYEHAKPAKARGTNDGSGRSAAQTAETMGRRGRFVPAKPVAGADVEQGLAPGGSGMFSTIGDYARFAQMLVNGGDLEGVRILGRKTVEMMTANHLAHLPRPTTEFSESDGFGLGVAVRIDLAKGNQLGSLGQFGWSGAATTDRQYRPEGETGCARVRAALPVQRARSVLAVQHAGVPGAGELSPRRIALRP